MHGTRPLWGLVACSGWLFLGFPTARTFAQSEPQPSQATASAYDGFIEQALQAYDTGRFAEARALFRRAHELSPTARTLRTIGMCAFNLGDYADAVWNLDAALSEQRKPLTDDQRRHVSDLIARSNQHVGRFRLRLAPAEAVLSVDGRVPPLTAQHELVLESGRHEIALRADGYRTAQSALSVEGGDHTTLELRLERAPLDEVAQAAGSESTRAAANEADGRASVNTSANRDQYATSHGSVQSTLGYVSLGVGVAGLAAFGVVGGLTIAKQSKLNEHCPQGQCAPAYHSDVDRYETLKATSTALLIGGGAFALLGAGLLLFHAERRSPEQERAALEPIVGFGTLGLRGQL